MPAPPTERPLPAKPTHACQALRRRRCRRFERVAARAEAASAASPAADGTLVLVAERLRPTCPPAAPRLQRRLLPAGAWPAATAAAAARRRRCPASPSP
eukprot:352860-Chlamydomonas_euryale.AAC.4